jgi:hypothetical protein
LSIQGPHLHLLESLDAEDFDLLCQLNGRALPRTGGACCRHFEAHTRKRGTKKSPLRVKKDFATDFFLKTPEREIRARTLILPSPRQEKPYLPTVEEKTIEAHIWKRKFEKMTEENVHLKIECLSLKEKQETTGQELLLTRELVEELKEKAKAQEDKKILSLIGSPYVHSKFWLGVADPVSLMEEWKDILTSKWDLNFLFPCFMVWMRRGMTFEFLSHFVGKSDTTLRRHFYKTLKDLQPWAKKQIGWPTLAEWRSKHHEKLRDVYPKTCFFWVDGTVVKMWCPKDSKVARVFYNKKHGGHSYVFFIVVAPNGEIVYLSECMAGTEHDKTHWNNSTGPDELEGRYQSEDFEFSMGGDKAYLGVRRPKNFLNHVTMTGLLGDDPEEEEVPSAQKEEWWNQNYTCDARIARFRAVVERTIGAIKKWLVLMNVALISRISYEKMQEMVLLCCALTNRQLRSNPSGTW